jgi:RNA polymerase sigma factor (sigma-70 family)
MAGATLQDMIRRLQRAAAREQGSGLSDAELLARFARSRDEASFELLVWRHGGMVLGTCRRLLDDSHAAEDAFQATFLALARQAESIGRGEALVGWLYRVACRIALRARAGATRRARCESQANAPPVEDPRADAESNELCSALHEELSRLPEKQRAAVILCYLEGQSTEEAARRLNCPRGTILSRLAHARERLRGRLARRGLEVTGAMLLATLSRQTLSAAPSAALIDPTVRAALSVAAGEAVPAGLVPARVAALTEGAVRAMSLLRMRIPLAVLLILGLAGAAAVLLAPARAAQQAGGQRTAQSPVAPAGTKPTGKPRTDQQRIQGTWEVVSWVNEGKKRPQRSLRLVFTAQYVLGKQDGRFTNEILTYELDPTQKPKALDLDQANRPGEAATPAVYALEGDTLTICLPLRGAGRPTEVASKPGSRTETFVLKRATKPEQMDDAGARALLEQTLARRQSARNLRQIGEALHKYHAEHKHFPPAAIYSKDGKPLLSWRVALLPQLGEENLYRQFKLDESWDSEHNKKLLAQMPQVYAPVAGVTTKEEHATFYRVFTGASTVFEGQEGVKQEAITDGLSATILAVEAAQAVPWTRPQELPYDGNPLPKLGGLFPDGFHILVADGAVRFVRRRFHEETFRRAITRDDGKSITLDALDRDR